MALVENEAVNLDFDEEGKTVGLEIIGATGKYSLSDIFNLSTENLIIEKASEKA